MALALVGIGSNIGARSAQLNEAVACLRLTANIEVRAVSRWHETLPIGGPPGQGAFLNGALLLETSLAPEALLQTFADIENRLGRQRDVRWQARTVDLDLLLYDNLQTTRPALSVPHPRFAHRRFVVEPAAEIAPDLIHPAMGWTLARLRDHLRHAKAYVAIAGPVGCGKTRLAAALAEHFAGRAIEAPPLPASRLAGATSGRALAWELELLAERGALLASRTWPDGVALAVSDFWFDQSLAYGRLRLDAREFIELRARYETLSQAIVPPKLVVLLTAPPARAGLTRPQPAQASGAERSGDDQNSPPADRLQRALRGLVGPRSGPVLELSADDTEMVWAEVVAAVAAMS
ncbi:MAG TPA: 2-amino-4-hydroxy-6-hydroxymethyldihydropteridine diphosphokinase [Pirellulales bacterium]|jgi:2-amino-4-hydroxy-6-hydroxymethyldihydropteridine diphosphokinase